MKKTLSDHPDYDNLLSTATMIRVVAEDINESVKSFENKLKLIEIQKSLIGFDEELIVSGRSLLKRGTVQKLSRKGKPQERELILLTDLLIYVKLINSRTEKSSTAHFQPIRAFHRKFSLKSIRILVVNEGDQQQNTFQVITPTKSFTVICSSIEDQKNWLIQIRKALSEINSDKPIWEAPVWQLDNSAYSCLICLEEFNFFRRRHHCRHCGKIVCATCSSDYFYVRGSDEVHRACDLCSQRVLTGDKRFEVIGQSVIKILGSISKPRLFFSSDTFALSFRRGSLGTDEIHLGSILANMPTIVMYI